MKDIAEQEVIDLDDMDVEAFNEFAAEQGWSDGMPLYVPTEAKVAKFVATVRGDNRPYPPVPPRQIVPTIQALAANAVMAGCKPEYFPVVTAALRGVLEERARGRVAVAEEALDLAHLGARRLAGGIEVEGTRSDGFRIMALPAASAGPIFHSGIIAGTLKGVMPATTPSGWRMA